MDIKKILIIHNYMPSLFFLNTSCKNSANYFPSINTVHRKLSEFCYISYTVFFLKKPIFLFIPFIIHLCNETTLIWHLVHIAVIKHLIETIKLCLQEIIMS